MDGVSNKPRLSSGQEMKLILYLQFPLFLLMNLYAQDIEKYDRMKLIEEEKIWSLEESYISHFSQANHEAILSLYHSEFLGWPDSESHPAGKKRAAIFLDENYPEPTQAISQISKEGIMILGNIAITHYLVTFSWLGENKMEQKTQTRITHTWIKEDSEWKILGGMSNRK